MSEEITGWTCYHCGEHFITHTHAKLHFGIPHSGAQPACIIKSEQGLVKYIRELEFRLGKAMEEDSDILRDLALQRCEKANAVAVAEELGYSRGLKDYTAREASHAEEVQKLREEIASNYTERDSLITQQAARIERLEGMLSYQSESIEKIAFMGMDKPMQADGESFYNSQLRNCIAIAANTNFATAETVAAFRDKLTEPLQKLSVTNILLRVVPGWDGSGEEVYAKTVADVEAELSRLACLIEDYETGEKVTPCTQAVIEPLRREVAMLHESAGAVADAVEADAMVSGSIVSAAAKLAHVLDNTQATAQAYEQEVEARGAVKALEDWIDNQQVVAVIEHPANDYARIVRKIDVSNLPSGTRLIAIRTTSKKAPDDPIPFWDVISGC